MGKLPQPTGPFQDRIATSELLLQEDKLLMCKVWYPTESINGTTDGTNHANNTTQQVPTPTIAPYVQPKYFPYLSTVLSMPLFLVRRYFSIGVHSYCARYSIQCDHAQSHHTQRSSSSGSSSSSMGNNDDYSPVLPLNRSIDRYPCVVFCAGLYGMPEHYTAICEELASQGYIVMAPYHTDGSCPAVLTNRGEIHWERGKEQFVDSTRLDDQDHVKNGMEQYRASQIEIRSSDVLDIVKTIEMYNNNNNRSVDNGANTTANTTTAEQQHEHGHVDDQEMKLFENRIDLNRLACIGHSFGGATAISSCTWLSERTGEPYFKIGISLDGWMEPLKFGYDLSKLSTTMTTTTSSDDDDDATDVSLKSSSDPFVKRLLHMTRERQREGHNDNSSNDGNDKQITVPSLAFINSEVWQWEDNKQIMGRIANYWSQWSRVYSWVMPRSGHHNYNDIGLLMPHFGRVVRILKTDLDPVAHMAALNSNLVDLLQLHLGSSGGGGTGTRSLDRQPKETSRFESYRVVSNTITMTPSPPASDDTKSNVQQ